MAQKFKVESGLQLLARLSKKPGIENFYPTIFDSGPKAGSIIELYSENCANILLYELITQALIPKEINGVGASIIIFNTDGNFDISNLSEILKYKLYLSLKSQGDTDQTKMNQNLDTIFKKCIDNLFIIETQNYTEFEITIQNLEEILIKYSHVSFIIFNTLTAYYWSEQDLKVTKMDIYLKKIVKFIQKVINGHKIVTLYVRPHFFSSNKVAIENLEPCCENPTEERVNFRIEMVCTNIKNNFINIQSKEGVKRKYFEINKDHILWI